MGEKYILYISTSPFYFSRGGVIDLNIDSQRRVGNHGLYWSSSTSTTSSHSYYLNIQNVNTYPSTSLARWFGFSVLSLPFYFSRSGNIDPLASSQRGLGTYGFYWSGTTHVTASNAYSLRYDNLYTLASLSDNRWTGFSACKAKYMSTNSLNRPLT